MTKIFDNIARAFYSLHIVTFVMVFVIISMIFFSHTLFLSVFPDSMGQIEKQVATWLMAIGWELTVLVTMCNPRHINTSIPAIVAIASACILLFFIEAFDFMQEPLIIVQRWFVGVLAGTINFIYARLFHRKWSERNEVEQLPMQLKQAYAELVELRAEREQLERTLHDSRANVDHFAATLKQRDTQLNELRTALIEFKKESICPYCKGDFESRGAMISHKGHCNMKPQKQQS